MSALLWDAQAAVKALLTAAVDVPVYGAGDLVGDDARAFVTVGAVGDGEELTATQERSSLGNGWLDVVITIPVTVTAWSGDADIAPVRATAKALLDACTSALNADQTLAGLLTPPVLTEVTDLSLREGQTPNGALVEAGFTSTHSALLVMPYAPPTVTASGGYSAGY